MYLEAGKLGIECISHYSDTILEGYIDIAALTSHNQENLYPGLLVWYGMDINGAVYINPEQQTINKSFAPNGVATVIVLGQYMIIFKDNDQAKKVFSVIAAIISNPTANADIETAINNAVDMFIF